ncbi:hypothetical protein J4439_00110 [Candidatus Woesearchaeota archaeon]|nr:hypothetical protein [Candidatus Woesearchaeota archaeon]
MDKDIDSSGDVFSYDPHRIGIDDTVTREDDGTLVVKSTQGWEQRRHPDGKVEILRNGQPALSFEPAPPTCYQRLVGAAFRVALPLFLAGAGCGIALSYLPQEEPQSSRTAVVYELLGEQDIRLDEVVSADSAPLEFRLSGLPPGEARVQLYTPWGQLGTGELWCGKNSVLVKGMLLLPASADIACPVDADGQLVLRYHARTGEMELEYLRVSD